MSHSGRTTTYYGSAPDCTPRLVIDPGTIVRQVDKFRSVFPGVEIYFPVKCCPLPVALITLHALGCRFEYASIAEIASVESIHLQGRPAIFGAPARTSADSSAALAAGVRTFVIDSIDEAVKLAKLHRELDVLIRLEVESSDTTMPLSTKFGVTAAGNVELTQACADLGLKLRGYVFHVGSQTRSAEPWARALESVSFARDAAVNAGHSIDTLDIGGGFPIAYRGSPVANIEDIAGTVHRSLARTGLDDLTLVAEPGRFLIAEAGEIHSHVLATTRDGNHARAVLDVGVFNGLYEVLEGVSYDFQLAGTADHEAPARLWQLAGPSCDGNDIVSTERALPDSLTAGDIVVVPDAGAYADSYASDFCGLEAPRLAIASGPGGRRTRNGVVRANSSVPLFDVAVELEYQLFSKAGLVDDDGSLGSYERYEPHSVMNVAFVDGEPVGVFREIWPSEDGFKTINDLETWPTTGQLLKLVGEDNIVDLGTIAVSPDHAGGDVTVALFQQAFRTSRAYGLTHWMAGLDNVVLSYMRTALGVNVAELGPSVDYIGSLSTPIIGALSDQAMTAFEVDPDQWDWLRKGTALDPENDFVGPLSWEGRLPSIVRTTIDLREPVAGRATQRRQGAEA